MSLHSLAVRARFEEQRALSFGSISGTYIGIGAAFSNPPRMLIIDNLTDADLQFSLDGTNDHFVVARRSGKIFDVSSNQSHDQGFFFSRGDRVYVQEIGTPTSGRVYVSAIYGATD